ncbi:MAG: NADH-quinone oxidoreductase subunit M [Thermotogaceae bacterium]|nr:NADH-quinone oxidoreductase subunit M [Thermotogaceae bacterium]
MSILTLLVASLLATPILYLLAKFNTKIAYGAYAVLQVFSFIYVFFTGRSNVSYEVIGITERLNFNFGITPTNWFFASIVLLIISMSAIFMFPLKKSPVKIFLLGLVSAGTLGAVFSQDFLTLMIFWEISTWASLILIIQDKEKSLKEAIKYVAIASIGTYSMLFAIFYMLDKLGSIEFSTVAARIGGATAEVQLVILISLGVMVLAKMGVFPLHIWLRGSHSSAPDEFSPILSGALTKIGAFLLFIITSALPSFMIFNKLPVFNGIPVVNYAFALLGGISIVVGTVMAIRMEDAKELIAFSTVSNSGYIVMALSIGGTYATAGGLMHVLNHAMASAAMFMAIAAVAYRTGTTKMHEMGGLILKMPVTFATYLVAIISIAGIPPTSGFVSKWLIYQQHVQNGLPFLAFAAFFGSIGSFMYVFKPLAGIFLGQLKPRHRNLKEVPFVMVVPMTILTLLTVFWGILPSNAIKTINAVTASVGINAVEVTFSRIVALTGEWDSILVTTVFAIGFFISLFIFMRAKKARQVDLMDNYTAGDFLYTSELYHFSYRMYRPFDRLFEKWPSMEDWLSSLSDKIKELGALLKAIFYPANPQLYIGLAIVAIIGTFWWLR